MVGHTQLKIRMAVVGTILFGLYLAVAGFVLTAFGTGTPVLILLSLGMVGYPFILYKFGRWSAVRGVGAEEMPERREAGYRFDEIHRSTERLCDEMDLEKPKLMIAEMGMPNAFAVGRRADGVVVISREIIEILDHDELEGVIAHELAHLDNRDTVMMVMGQSIAALVGMVTYIVVAFRGERDIASIITGYLASMVAQMIVTVFLMAISRYREYVADADAAEYTRNPDAMARALEKISAGAEGKEMTAEESVSALCIFGGERGLFATLFASHPPTEKRIERLRSM
ncbi:M48 family metallopeptidase [Halovenus salina]|uniref:M48 family metallopeptidase n=1 Tax=Halovenus salina TaxID=1510225 RepID=UPI0022609BD3|nr:M48 family metalloprotease [Halovenus salina]